MFPELAMVEPGMEGVAESEAALRFWREEWAGQSFMAIGAKHPDAPAMYTLRRQIRGCPEPLVLSEAGHFVPEWGEPVAERHYAPSVISRKKRSRCHAPLQPSSARRPSARAISLSGFQPFGIRRCRPTDGPRLAAAAGRGPGPRNNAHMPPTQPPPLMIPDCVAHFIAAECLSAQVRERARASLWTSVLLCRTLRYAMTRGFNTSSHHWRKLVGVVDCGVRGSAVSSPRL